jgi:hypothetical protein
VAAAAQALSLTAAVERMSSGGGGVIEPGSSADAF